MKFIRYLYNKIIFVSYITNDTNHYKHNKNGPSYISYCDEICGNKLYYKEFCLYNKRHNTKYPARINYGNSPFIEYWVHDKCIENIFSNKELKRYLKLQNII